MKKSWNKSDWVAVLIVFIVLMLFSSIVLGPWGKVIVKEPNERRNGIYGYPLSFYASGAKRICLMFGDEGCPESWKEQKDAFALFFDLLLWFLVSVVVVIRTKRIISYIKKPRSRA
ncbi:MAG TPA: hypothetical protein P5277_03515 [Candidatus Paceibacterota bacterium]|nr:hypothetical protein [Candidatus Paceibacterota bacterium]